MCGQRLPWAPTQKIAPAPAQTQALAPQALPGQSPYAQQMSTAMPPAPYPAQQPYPPQQPYPQQVYPPQQPYPYQNGPYPPMMMVTVPPASSMSIASLVTGIIGFLFSWFWLLGVPCLFISLGLGITVIRQNQPGRSLAIIGIILSSIVLAIWAIIVMFFMMFAVGVSSAT
jgi:hypothetical protein